MMVFSSVETVASWSLLTSAVLYYCVHVEQAQRPSAVLQRSSISTADAWLLYLSC